MRIKINIQIFAIIIIFILTKQIEIYMWLMLFAFIHELAHMIIGLVLKLKPKAIEIHGFGLGIILEGYDNIKRNQIIIPMAGPIINFIIAFLFQFIHIKSQGMIINSNLLIGLCNLIPIYPLDGGRILKILLREYKTVQEAEYIINRISNTLMIIITVLSSILIMLYKNIGLFLIIVYLWVIVIKENRRYNIKKQMYRILTQKL